MNGCHEKHFRWYFIITPDVTSSWHKSNGMIMFERWFQIILEISMNVNAIFSWAQTRFGLLEQYPKRAQWDFFIQWKLKFTKICLDSWMNLSLWFHHCCCSLNRMNVSHNISCEKSAKYRIKSEAFIISKYARIHQTSSV